jgi:hypothetical protein
MSRRALRLLFVLTLTLALAAPVHAAPWTLRQASDSFLARAVAWIHSVWGIAVTRSDEGGMMDPNGDHH